MITDHLPDAGKAPTDQDYARDLAADLEIQQAATEGPWAARENERDPWGLVRSASGRLVATAAVSGRSADEAATNSAAIANAGTHAQGWLRRALAAEAAIMEWVEARSQIISASTPTGMQTHKNLSAKEGHFYALAARIRAGREKGARL